MRPRGGGALAGGLAAETLAELGIAHGVRVVSAHRTTEDMLAYGRDAKRRGWR